MQQTYNYLALGDSYTIGESVNLYESFPYQLVQLLRRSGITIAAPEVIAKTGWTTDELQAAMQSYRFLNKYDLVTLLIGVNNQYRGRDAVQYKMELEDLLIRAIELANDKPSHVIVVSIPDYGATPFAAQMDRDKISSEIDIFNNINKALSIQYKTHYADITPGSKKAISEPGLVASDQLHPSEKEYGIWAEKIAKMGTSLLK
jgi:lysophospholipase L1-like esterase